MGSYICKQPNGKYCRFSTVVDTVTDWNMTKEDYIELCKKKAEKEAIDVLQNHLQPFERIREDFSPNNNTQREFNKILKEMEI